MRSVAAKQRLGGGFRLALGGQFRLQPADLRAQQLDSLAQLADRQQRQVLQDAELVDQVRCVSAMFTLHAGMFVLNDLEGDPEAKRKAVLEVATDLITQAHRGPHTA